MIKLEKVNKYFNHHKKNEIHVIDNTSLELPEKGLVALLGPSGCGKTTLLNAIGGLDNVKSGKIYVNGKRITIKLNSEVNQNDQIRLDGLNNEEISIPLTKIYDLNGKLINHATDYFMLDLSEKVKVGALVYKTKDTAYLESINKTYPAEFRRFPLTIIVKGQIGEVLHLYVNYEEYHVHVESDCLVEVAKTSSVTEANFKDLLAKLNDTPYYLDQLYVDFSNNAFIPLKVISNLKREAITKLNDLRLETSNIPKEVKTIQVPLLEVGPRLTVQVQNEEQYAAVKALGIKDIYYQNIVPRNNAKYPSFSDVVLVGGLGGVNHYAKTNDVVTDYSLNVVNATTLAMLYNLGVKRVTLSYENNKDNIQALIADFKKQYNQTPPVEVIAYGRQNLMVTKYCPLKRLNMCGKCKTNQFSLKDDFADFPLKFNDDCSITIWNSRILNLVDDLDGLQDVTIRLVFTTEDSETMKAVIGMFKDKINNPNSPTKYFNQATDTRGYFYKEIA